MSSESVAIRVALLVDRARGVSHEGIRLQAQKGLRNHLIIVIKFTLARGLDVRCEPCGIRNACVKRWRRIARPPDKRIKSRQVRLCLLDTVR